LLGRHRSTISRELSCGRGQRGYRAEQACAKASERTQHSRNARRVDPKFVMQAFSDKLLGIAQPMRQNMTYDQGRDMAMHKQLSRRTGVTSRIETGSEIHPIRG